MTADSTTSLGEFLRQEREKRGITIEQVASATKIGVRILHALESDQYCELPAKPFVRGFVTSYARFIGLDAHEILTRFGDFIDGKAHDRPSREAGLSGYAFERREGEQSRTILWVVMGSFLVVGAAVMLVLKPTLKHHHESHAEKLRAAHVKAVPVASPSPAMPLVGASPLAAPAPSTVPTASPTAAPVPTATPTAPTTPAAPKAANTPVSSTPLVLAPTGPISAAEPSPTPTATASPKNRKPDPLNSGVDLLPSEIKHKAVFKALADVWVRYKVDDKPTMKFVLRADRILVLRGQQAIRFQASNPKSITVTVSGKGSKTLSSEKSLTARPSGETLILSTEPSEKTKDPFSGEKPLPATPAPTPRTASPEPTPTP